MVVDHSDMRMANASLKKLVEKNYKKGNFLKEYGPMIGFGILIFLLGLVAWLLLTEANKISGSLGANVDNMRDIMESLGNILQSMENIETKSGLRNIG